MFRVLAGWLNNRARTKRAKGFGMKPGDLIRDTDSGEVGLVMRASIDWHPKGTAYLVKYSSHPVLVEIPVSGIEYGWIEIISKA